MRHLLIQSISVDKLFTLKELNRRITSFNYGPDVTNKPTKLSPHHITPSGHIKQSGKAAYYAILIVIMGITYSKPNVVFR